MFLSQDSYQIDEVTLRPFTAQAAKEVAVRMAAFDPWARLAFTPQQIENYLLDPSPCAYRFVIESGGRAVGAVSLRSPWLFGPYLELLALLPEEQGRGCGGRLLQWLMQEAGGEYSNLWLSVSSFNNRAISFYEEHGFEHVGLMPDLVRRGFDEILMRRRLDRKSA